MVFRATKMIDRKLKNIKGFRWKFEVFKMWFYIYTPIFTWYAFNTDYVQVNFVYPYLKRTNYGLYKKLALADEDDDDDKSSSNVGS